MDLCFVCFLLPNTGVTLCNYIVVDYINYWWLAFGVIDKDWDQLSKRLGSKMENKNILDLECDYHLSNLEL
ncbi:hypothetical protein QVD17_37334 [Tagetes erecta]|uniref:Uncharacterized protein n=1 Tax=Tagetes erecta TaxID=13708 RepID=A0AAD8JTV6_TARER|nr:hypothetical protein QVD17_37334 [Tagetes erecta]